MSAATKGRLEYYKDMTPEKERAEGLAPDDGQVPPRRGFQLRRASELEIRPPDWLVLDLLEADSLALLFGDPSAGKSFIALDLAVCIATGTAFHGRRIAKPGPVVYIAGEGHSGLARRLRAWSIARKVSIDTAPLYVSTLPAALCDPGMMDEVMRVVTEAAKEAGPLCLIILDTWSRNLGGDENSSADTALAIAALDRLRAPWRAAGLAIHHVGHGEKIRARGSTVLRGAIDLELCVERGTDLLIRVSCKKAKDIQPPEPMAFRLEDVGLGIIDDEGRSVGSAVLEEEDFRTEEAPRAPSGKNQKRALEVLITEIERHRKNIEDSGREASEARVSVDTWREACSRGGIDRRRFGEAKNGLLNAKAIQVQDGLFVTLFSSNPLVRPVDVRLSESGGTIYPPDFDGHHSDKAIRTDSDVFRTKSGQDSDSTSKPTFDEHERRGPTFDELFGNKE